MTLDEQPTTVYRFFDASGVLLYVGITNNPAGRFTGHSCTKPWFADVTTITLEQFTTRREALEAERAAIRDESPIHNEAVPNRGRSPREHCVMCGLEWALTPSGRFRYHEVFSPTQLRKNRCSGSGTTPRILMNAS